MSIFRKLPKSKKGLCFFGVKTRKIGTLAVPALSMPIPERKEKPKKKVIRTAEAKKKQQKRSRKKKAS